MNIMEAGTLLSIRMKLKVMPREKVLAMIESELKLSPEDAESLAVKAEKSG